MDGWTTHSSPETGAFLAQPFSFLYIHPISFNYLCRRNRVEDGIKVITCGKQFCLINMDYL